MSANNKKGLLLLCLTLALAGLLGVFVIMEASSANASLGESASPSTVLQPSIIITPTQLHATLHPDELLTQTLWITNTGDSDLTFTIYEMTTTVRLDGFTLEPVSIPLVDPQVQAQITAQGSASAIIFLREKPDLSPAYRIPSKNARRLYVYNRLLATASHSEQLFQWLESQGAQPHRLLIANAIAASLNTSQLASLAGNPLVRQISTNRQYSIIPSSPTPLQGPQLPTVSSFQPDSVEWNIAKIRADEAWSTFDITGTGAVVGIVDTGVMYTHPALVNSYRGNLGGGNFDHNYNWFDFVSGQPVPYDDNGHGTLGAGIVSGDDGSVNQIGVAPGANWITAKACTGGGSCDDTPLLNALQWMLAPTDLNGENPDPSKAPDIVLGMWGGMSCDTFFESSMQALRAAGIIPVFAPGGSGPGCGTIGSPGDLSEVLSAGATDQNDNVGEFSARGPSCFGVIKPDVTAPGVNIRTSYNNGGYYTYSGTSPSAAHLAGALAMILSANPSLSMDQVTDILFSSSLCIEELSCGGTACPGGANNVYGHGRIDVYQAVALALGILPHIDLPWLSETPISTTLPAGEGIAISIAYDSSGLEAGAYTGALGILSNDPNLPFSSVPVTLEVINTPAPRMVIDPLSFTASLAVGGMHTDTLTISNTGDATLTVTLYEVTATQGLVSAPLEIPMPTPVLLPADSPVQVDADVQTQLLLWGQSRLIVYLRGLPDFSAAYRITDRASRAQYVYDQLLKQATHSGDLYNWLLSQGTQPRRLLTANAIAATLNVAQLEMVHSFPQVGRVGINGYAEIIQNENIDPGWLNSVISQPDSVEWNISKIRADEAWSTFGIRGQGAVVGVVDTGVMYTHPALNSQYRGSLGGGNYENNYNWYDLINGQLAPYDDHGHGTFGTGIVLGDDGLGNQIGVAPGAKWIAVKALDAYGGATYETLHAALQWMLAPTDLSGNNPNPKFAPDVVLNMWGISSYNCDHSFDSDLVALRTANILPVFAPGGEGPGCETVSTPATDPNALSAGATDNNDIIGPFSAKGPSCYDGSIKPDLSAPGVDIRSSTTDGSYQVWSGTSFSTAHLAGAAALLFSADSRIGIDELEQTLFDTAVCHDDAMYCGGDACPDANNTYGYGRIDVFEAISQTMSTNPPYDLPWLIVGPLAIVMPPGGTVNVPVTFDARSVQPGTYTGGIGIESNDPQAPFTILPVTLTVSLPCQPVNVQLVGFTPSHPQVGEVITFTAVATGTLPIDYSWDFGDGSSSTGSNVTHFYDHPGTFLMGLTVENDCGIHQVQIDVIVDAGLKSILLPLVSR